jgi:hypothetical protein
MLVAGYGLQVVQDVVQGEGTPKIMVFIQVDHAAEGKRPPEDSGLQVVQAVEGKSLLKFMKVYINQEAMRGQHLLKITVCKSFRRPLRETAS